MHYQHIKLGMVVVYNRVNPLWKKFNSIKF